MVTTKQATISNGREKNNINIIIHNPNEKTDFDKFYTNVIIKTLRLMINSQK